ncbi:DNA cytosine methyltransferase [Robiginitalea sp. SC105]|uniref:DNA cytosine methyltransferase n=1 Tax=Robiginitalea sp. SC105 TaxID=2762332 RepID=UPI00163AA162|nr:DNA cytosine methyltransferase [Robiginitalea sp. SC105]MBC2840100.1 DNA cytosine methyltransferase [Robiginitalea sp. SC105]
MINKLTVVDFFCGAGGFSEGFRQQGFTILRGVDKWIPAVRTFNHNFDLNDPPRDILDYWDSIELINEIPNSDVIVGSPPCVSFSNSNRSGKADKSLGLRLTETFLRIVAVKKFQERSKLKAWFMENVTNTLKYLPKSYSFEDLNLSEWALNQNLLPSDIAISIEGNSTMINSAHFGSPQSRKRAIVGEIVSKGKLIVPPKTHSQKISEKGNLLPSKTLKSVLRGLPRPNVKKSSRRIRDPLYPEINIPLQRITDHFYDSGLYKTQWNSSLFMKRNHPYMGRMSFPEEINKPSRTVTATKIGSSREALIYRSEYRRKGDGEFRIPTVREMACLMSFPITYQFLGDSEYSKCRLVGNAVCPTVSGALAKTVLKQLGLQEISTPIVATKPKLKGVRNLNTYEARTFDHPPKKKPGARFRRHPFKYGNITVTLSNYDILSGKQSKGWITSVQYGNGEGFPCRNIADGFYKEIEPIIKDFNGGEEFIQIVNNGFTNKIASASELQRMHELQQQIEQYLDPSSLIEEVAELIDEFEFENPFYDQGDSIVFNNKEIVPKKQIMALYTINKITSVANKK